MTVDLILWVLEIRIRAANVPTSHPNLSKKWLKNGVNRERPETFPFPVLLMLAESGNVKSVRLDKSYRDTFYPETEVICLQKN